jgi:para-nitrobenzyl esterase
LFLWKRGSLIRKNRRFLVLIPIFLISSAFLLFLFRDSFPKKDAALVESWKGSSLVHTEEGDLRGFNPRKGVLSWQGVDYASAPLGALRWQKPRPVVAWSGVRLAKEPGEQAIQYSPLTGAITGSEDCLHVNIWRPDNLNSKLPIYVWIHGGANTAGYSSPEGDYDGSNLSRLSGFLVVSMDYRLGPFGWFANSNLVEAGSGGNLGLLDIIFTLEWVRANAASFGGDPDRVTVAGESAGASNILGLLLGKRAKGLFHRAILQSPLDLFSTLEEARNESRLTLCRILIHSGKAADLSAAGEFLNAMTSVDYKTFFNSLAAEELLTGLSPEVFGMYDWPTLIRDGKVLPAKGISGFASGQYAVKVPIIIGSNHDEVGIFLFTAREQAALMPLYDKAFAWGSAAWNAWVENLAITMASSRGQAPVRLYRFDWGSPDEKGASPLPSFFTKDLGAFHSLEIPFFLGNDTVAGEAISGLIFNRQNAPGREALSSAIRRYTADFVRGGPMRDYSGLPNWPALLSVKKAAKAKKSGEKIVLGLALDGNNETALIRPYSLSATSGLSAIRKDIDAAEIIRIRELLPYFLKNTLAPYK